MYIERSDKAGTRGSMTVGQAWREIALWQASAPKDATLRILRDDRSVFEEYRYTMGDDGYAAWHRY